MSGHWAKLAPAAGRLERGSTAHDRITAADVAGATRGLEPGPFLAGMVFLAGDDSSWQGLSGALEEEAGVSPGVARAALFEMKGGNRCPRCQGKGILAPQVQCPTCHGKRTVRPTGATLAALAGVSRATWYRSTCHAYERAYSTLQAWVHQASRHVSRGLRE